MAVIKSSSEHLTLNADGAGKDIKFQANGVEKASISSAGAFTSTSIDATKLSGALPAIDGSALTGLAGGGLQSQQVFTSSGSTTWTKPAGVNLIKVYITGGGGGGMGSSNSYKCSGGAGGTAIKVIDVSAISSVTVTIGAGGTPSQNSVSAGTGGTSSFGAHCSATGGNGGWSPAWYGGKGGVGTGGDINLTGTGGEFESSTNTTAAGGGSLWGGGGTGLEGMNTSSNGHHGGGGGGADNATTSYGYGGVGICVVEEYK